MDRETWSSLAIFAAIVDAGSFTKAAGSLGVSPSALSHAMRKMEARLGVRLLNRTTRSVAPTEAGEQMLARLRPAMSDVEAALEGLNAQRDRPAGRVRISAHRTAAVHAVLPRMAQFAEDYPDIMVELVVEDALVDIVSDRFDAGIRHEQMLDQDMVAVRIGGPQRTVIAAAPRYFARFSAPDTPHDLQRHRCLNYRYTSSGSLHLWQFIRDGRPFAIEAPGAFTTNDVNVLVEAAVSGIGIACLSEPQAARHIASGALVPVLQDWCRTIPPNYLYYPSRRQVTAALRAFIAALRDPGG